MQKVNDCEHNDTMQNKKTFGVNCHIKFTFQPCLAACIDQTHKFLVTQATYPNEDSFTGTINFCLVLRKLVKSCKGDRRKILDIKYPDLCLAIEREPRARVELECFKNSVLESVSFNTILLLFI